MGVKGLILITADFVRVIAFVALRAPVNRPSVACLNRTSRKPNVDLLSIHSSG